MSRVSSVRCPSCGSAAPAAEEFCRRCGNDLTSPGLLPIMDDPADRTEIIVDRPPDRLRPPGPPRAPGGRRRTGRPVRILGAVLAAALLFATGYAGYRIVADRRTQRQAAQSDPGQPPRTGPTGPTARPATTPSSTGSLVVAAPALSGRPETAAVVSLFTTYFDGINRRDYDAVQGSFTDAGRPVRDQAKFQDEYRTTHDADVRILGITRTGVGYNILISFVSYQNPEDAPANAPYNCVSWSMTYPVIRTTTGALLINDNPGAGATASSC